MTQPNSPPNRNKEIRRVRVADLEDAPWNFREHTDGQNAAFGGTVDEIGWVGYPDVYETPDGLRIVDGHLRKAWLLQTYGPDAEIEVNVTDLDERDAKVATLTHDTLAGMAEINPEVLCAAYADVTVEDESLRRMLTELSERSGADLLGDEVDAGEVGENDPDAEWTGMPEFENEDQTGIRAVIHFETEAAKRDFEKLIGQQIPANTKSVWFPKKEWANMKSKEFV